MVMGEGFSQVSNDDSGDNGNGDNDGEDRKDKNTSKKLWNGLPALPVRTLSAVSLRCLIDGVQF